MVEQPTGTVTFLFTDVERSTPLWESSPRSMGAAVARHDDIVRAVATDLGGYVFTTAGDSFAVAFGRAPDAIAAASELQDRLESEPWPAEAPIRVRVGVHVGEAEERGGDYFGPAVNRAARVMSAAHGGQVLVTDVVASLVDTVALLELGVYRLKGLEAPERLWQLGTRQFPPLRVESTRHTNLPVVRSSLVGRSGLVARVCEILTTDRMVTLTGVGGVGKTRLALAVAADSLPLFDDGVWFCELAPVDELAAVIHVVGSVLGIDRQPGMTDMESLLAGLRRRHCLLVLDNCEHVVDDVAELVDAMLDSGDRVVILTTSREGLAVEGERLVAVPPLDTSDSKADGMSPAVELFLSRASAMHDSFVGTQDADVVKELCRRLDGVPLAIELAAARTVTLSPVEILERLDDRFRLLSGVRRRGRNRHQTLERTIDWSHDLLADPTRQVMRKLAVYGGSFGLAAAEAVVCAVEATEPSDLLDHVSELVAKSMLVADNVGGRTRYRFLETLRQYAEKQLERAGEVEAATTAAAQHLVALAEETTKELLGPTYHRALAELDIDMANHRRAVDVAIERGDVNTAFGIIGPFHQHVNGPSNRFTAMATTAWAGFGDTEQPMSAAVLTLSAEDHMERGDNNTAADLTDAALNLQSRSGRPPLVSTLVLRATLEPGRGNIAEAYDYAQQAVRAAVESGEVHLEVCAHLHRITVGRALGHLDENQAIEEARDLCRLAEATPNPTAKAQAHWTLGDALINQSPREALTELEACQRHAPGGRIEVAGVVWTSWTCVLLNRFDDAVAALAPSLRRWRLNSHQLYLDVAHVIVANVIAATDPEIAARLLGAARGTGEVAFYLPTAVARASELVNNALGPARSEQIMRQAVNDSPEYIADVAIGFVDP